MRRGTTPTIAFNLPFDTSTIRNCEIYFSQDDSLLLTKGKDECTLSGALLYVTLTQEETLMFDDEIKLQIQVRFVFTDGTVDATTILKEKVEQILKEGVINVN